MLHQLKKVKKNYGLPKAFIGENVFPASEI